MPAPARISVPFKQSTHLKSAPNSIPKTPTSIPRTKARVVHRQRARGRLGDTESDDELVREPHSDSESDSATSTLDTDSISESEPEDESKPDARVPSPSHTPLVNGEPASPTPSTRAKAPVFPPTLDWSDMVADENANGAAALPVIDFADFSSHTQAASPPPPTATLCSPPPAAGHPQLSQSSHAASSSPPARKPGQSARQAYLTRLDNDPAYVPTLGQFWSHDDRLLDKDLRSLSGWWRGRWQGRGRPRGRGGFGGGWGMRGARGRGGAVNGGPGGSFTPEDAPEEDTLSVNGAWTHDGFEEMKQAEEERRQQFQFRGKNSSSRGRRGFRGGFFGRDRLGSAPRTSSPHGSFARLQSEPSTFDTLKFGNGARPWFSMKPERVWTKQFDGYLYFEAQLKPVHNQGLGQGVRVKLPKQKDKRQDVTGPEGGSVVVRLPQRNAIPSRPLWATAKDLSPERAFVVKLPGTKGAGKERAHLSREDVTTVTPPPMDEPLPTIRSAPVASVQRPLTQEAPAFTPSHPPLRRASEVVVSLPTTSTIAPAEHPAGAPPLRRHTSNELSTSGDLASAGPSHLQSQGVPQGAQPAETGPPQEQPPVLSTVQTVAPQFQASPPYGSPYGYAASGLPLPPGIAVSESGVTYEIATGRTVYLHTPPPPPPPPQMQVPMYNPRPIPMHHAPHASMHFLPHHGHAPSMSLSVSPPAFSSSLPIFALPRQSSRIEIKAPSEEKGTERAGELDRPGGDGRLTGPRTTVNVNAEPFTPAAHPQLQSPGYYPVESQQAFDEGQQHHQPHPSMSYQPTPYYFLGPDGSASYGYQYPNIDARSPQQQYESYAQDTYPQQHAIYY